CAARSAPSSRRARTARARSAPPRDARVSRRARAPPARRRRRRRTPARKRAGPSRPAHNGSAVPRSAAGRDAFGAVCPKEVTIGTAMTRCAVGLARVGGARCKTARECRTILRHESKLRPGGRGRRGEACFHDEVSYDTRAPFCTARRQHEPGPPRTASSRCQSSPPSGKLRRMRLDRLPISVLRIRYVPGGWDLLAFVLVFAFFVYAAQAARGLAGSLAHLEAVPISLAPSALVGYSARTALRM